MITRGSRPHSRVRRAILGGPPLGLSGSMPTQSCVILQASTLSAAHRTVCADLAIEALPEFYNYVAVTRSALVQAVADEISAEGCELSETVAMLKNGAVAGICCSYPAEELSSRQGISLLRLLELLPAKDQDIFLQDVREHAASIPRIPSATHYLARIAVDRPFRGTGIAAHLLDHFLSQGEPERGWSLHVSSENERAKAFYYRHGFRTIGSSEGRFLLMTRP